MFVISFSTYHASQDCISLLISLGIISTSWPRGGEHTKNYTHRYYTQGYNLAFFICFCKKSC